MSQILHVTYTECHILVLYAECSYSKGRNAECRYAGYHSAECHGTLILPLTRVSNQNSNESLIEKK